MRFTVINNKKRKQKKVEKECELESLSNVYIVLLKRLIKRSADLPRVQRKLMSCWKILHSLATRYLCHFKNLSQQL